MTQADRQFDDLTKRLAAGLSRRQLLRLFVGGSLGAAGLTAVGGQRAAWARPECTDVCGGLTGSDFGACQKTCTQCRRTDGLLCNGGTGLICCAPADTCCVSSEGQICCPPGWHCCIGRFGALRCCARETECCGSGCCEPGRCCVSQVAPAVQCCTGDEVCCFDPDFNGGDVRCGTLDPLTGNCVPLAAAR